MCVRKDNRLLRSVLEPSLSSSHTVINIAVLILNLQRARVGQPKEWRKSGCFFCCFGFFFFFFLEAVINIFHPRRTSFAADRVFREIYSNSLRTDRRSKRVWINDASSYRSSPRSDRSRVVAATRRTRVIFHNAFLRNSSLQKCVNYFMWNATWPFFILRFSGRFRGLVFFYRFWCVPCIFPYRVSRRAWTLD